MQLPSSEPASSEDRMGSAAMRGGDVPHVTRSLMRATTWLMLALGSVYAITLVPGIGPAGYSTAIDWWLNMTVDALVILVIAFRIVIDQRDRAAWLLMVAGLVAAFA